MSQIQAITFQANFSCFIGCRGIVCGEPLTAHLTDSGTYALYRMASLGVLEDDPVAWLNPDDLDKLAGRCVTAEEPPTPKFEATCGICGAALDIDQLYCDHSNPALEAIEAQP